MVLEKNVATHSLQCCTKGRLDSYFSPIDFFFYESEVRIQGYTVIYSSPIDVLNSSVGLGLVAVDVL